MEEFQTKQKSNFFMGLVSIIAGALLTCAFYFGILKLGIFSPWVSAIGITISLMGHNHFVKGSDSFGFILASILNAIGIIYGEFLDWASQIGSLSDLMFDTRLFKKMIVLKGFWIYPAIGIAIMLVIGFINRKVNFSDKDNK